MRQVVPYKTEQSAGTIVVNTGENFLYLVLGSGKALRYGIGTAKTASSGAARTRSPASASGPAGRRRPKC